MNKSTHFTFFPDTLLSAKNLPLHFNLCDRANDGLAVQKPISWMRCFYEKKIILMHIMNESPLWGHICSSLLVISMLLIKIGELQSLGTEFICSESNMQMWTGWQWCPPFNMLLFSKKVFLKGYFLFPLLYRHNKWKERWKCHSDVSKRKITLMFIKKYIFFNGIFFMVSFIVLEYKTTSDHVSECGCFTGNKLF